MGDDSPEPVSWGALYEARRAAASRFGTLFQLPVRARILREVAPRLSPGARVLDVGAGDRRARDRLASHVSGLEYVSVDPDPAGDHDFASIDEAPTDFDAVLLLEVLEHLGVEDALDLLRAIRERLRPGGLLAVTTPNVAHSWAFFRDATHRTPWAHDELAGAVGLCGFEVARVFRLHHAPWLWSTLRRTLAAPIHRLLSVDYAPGVGLLGFRPPAG